jgi:electron transport complex protein RnfD
VSDSTQAAPAPRILRSVAPAPHIAASLTCRQIMLWVIAALLPAAAWAVWNMGTPAVITLATSIGSCVATEFIWNAVLKRKQSETCRRS